MAKETKEEKAEKTAQNLPTIDLKGKNYVQVKDRIIYFNETYLANRIENIPTFMGNNVLFSSKVTPDVAIPERFFTGHSFGSVNGEKALEKLETVALGRALAMMGIGVLESIASADEMQSFNQSQSSPQPQASYPQNLPQDAYDTWQGLQMQDENTTAYQTEIAPQLCPECNSPMNYVEGKSKTTGKPYKMWKCAANKDHKPVWVN